MKKSLLFLSFAAIASLANAQTTVVLATTEDFEAAGLSGTKVDKPGGTVIVSNPEVGSFELAYDDSWGTTSCYKNYRVVKVNDSEEITLNSGAVGNANPTFSYYEDGVMSGGAVFKISAKKDGYMTVFTKINPNKQYLVFENKTGALGYTLGVAGADYKIHYTTPVYTTGDETGYIDFNAPDASKYFIVGTVQRKNAAGELIWLDKDGKEVAGERPVWVGDDGKEKKGAAVMDPVPGTNKPQFPYLVAGMEKAPGESTGFLSFNVLAGNDYYFSALGSKAACGGFIFTETEPTVTLSDPDGALEPVVFEAGGASAVEDITIGQPVLDENAPIYNTQGVRVCADAKGILIQNGKKFVRF